ncbi:MAG: hypothetical protein ACP5GS_08755, partial [Nitrososphaeria archaeon]
MLKSARVLSLFNGTLERSRKYEGVTMLYGDELFEKMKEMTGATTKRIYRIIAGTGLIVKYNAGIVQEEINASKRGVKVYVITDVNVQNVSIAMEYSRSVYLKHLYGANFMLRYVTYDSMNAVIISSNPYLLQKE